MLALQRAAGNRAVAALLQRQEAGAGGGFGYRPPRIRLLDEQLHLDPALEAQLQPQRPLTELLDPAFVRRALLEGAGGERPAWLPQPGERPPEEQPLVPRGAGPETPREATAGDLFGAVMAIPSVDAAVTRLRDQAGEHASRDWSSLSPGERGLVLTSGALIGGGALAGAISSEESRNLLLQQLNGRNLPVPGVSGLNVAFQTQPDNLGVMFTLDVGRHLPTSWGF